MCVCMHDTDWHLRIKGGFTRTKPTRSYMYIQLPFTKTLSPAYIHVSVRWAVVVVAAAG